MKGGGGVSGVYGSEPRDAEVILLLSEKEGICGRQADGGLWAATRQEELSKKEEHPGMARLT